MSFTWHAAAPLYTPEQWMATFIKAAEDCGMPDVRGAAVCEAMCAFQEAGGDPYETGTRQIWIPGNLADPCYADNPDAYPHDSESNDHLSSGPFQQQMNEPGETPWGWGGVYGDCAGTAKRMDPYQSAVMFLSWPGSGLKSKGYNAGGADIAGQSVQAVQGSAFPGAYSQWFVMAEALYDKVAGSGTAPIDTTGATPVSTVTPTDPRLALLTAARPDFNEYPLWCENSESRQGTVIDLILGHTEENSGYDNADGLAHYLASTAGSDNPVSYHRTISKGQNDDGVTVVDVVPTNLAAWAVGNSNLRSINMCFAGSRVAWTRQEWIDNCGRSFDVFGYLAVRDALVAGWTSIPVIPGPNYNADPPGVSDHRYCSDYLHDGNNHTDMGDNVPWDRVEAAVQKYWAIANPPVVTPPPVDVPPSGSPAASQPTDSEYEVLAQTRGRWKNLGQNADGSYRTPIEALGVLVDHAEGTNNAGNAEFAGW